MHDNIILSFIILIVATVEGLHRITRADLVVRRRKIEEQAFCSEVTTCILSKLLLVTYLVCQELHDLYLAGRLGLLSLLHLFIKFLLELWRQLKRSIASGMLTDLHIGNLTGAFGDVT